MTIGRREFVAAVAGGFALSLRPGAATSRQQQRRLVIDGLGEIHLDYEMALIDQIRASGMRGCVVTVGNPALQGPEAFDDMKGEIEGYDRHVATHPDRFLRATSLADLDRAAASERIGLVYYTQNATPIQDKVERLQTLHDLGVRIVQLTYNTRNLVGDGCLERTNVGLSRFGVEVVERLNALNVLVDASHCGEATTLDAIEFSNQPVAITHAGCQAVFEHPRNKSDAVLRKLHGKGGVIGIYQINPYLGSKGRNNLDDYLRHIDHAVQVAGIDHVGIGSDREHRTIPDTEERSRS